MTAELAAIEGRTMIAHDNCVTCGTAVSQEVKDKQELGARKYYDGGLWCGDCRARWKKMADLQRKFPDYCERGIMLGYRLRRDRLPL